MLVLAAAAVVAQQTVPVTAQGLGAAKFGMNVGEFGAALDERFTEPQALEDRACFYLEAKKFPGVAFMFANGLLRGIDVRTLDVVTSDGIRVVWAPA
jgi:hypothetical protein